MGRRSGSFSRRAGARRGRPARWALILAAVSASRLLVGAGLTLENASYSHGGRLPFSFSYRGLYHATPAPGEYVR